MKIADKCDSCGKKTSNLILTATCPRIKHLCRDCCEQKSIPISNRYDIAEHLV